MSEQEAWGALFAITPIVISTVSLWITLAQTKRSQRTADKALEQGAEALRQAREATEQASRQAQESRVDPLRYAAFSDMAEGMRECYEVVVRLIAGRDRFQHAEWTARVEVAHREGQEGLERIKVLKRKWASSLPLDFQGELTKFTAVFRSWQIAVRPLHNEWYTPRLGEFEAEVEESRSRLGKMLQEATRSEQLLGEARRTLRG